MYIHISVLYISWIYLYSLWIIRLSISLLLTHFETTSLIYFVLGNAKTGKEHSPLTADIFLDYFTHVGTNIHETSQKTTQTFQDFFDRTIELNSCLYRFQSVATEEVEKIISKCKGTDTLDVYGLSNKILKTTKSHISQVIAHIINVSLDRGVYPDELKLAYIMPKIKKGATEIEAYEVCSYKPMAMMPRIAKTFETVLRNQLEDHLMNNKLYIEEQHGYIKGRSRITAQLRLSHCINKAFQDNEKVVFVKRDLSKALDTISPIILVEKLRLYGVNGKALKLVELYLKNRKIFVKWNGSESNISIVRTGLLRGAVLSPLLFNIYLRDLPRCIASDVTIYGDDIAIIVSYNEFYDVERRVKEALARFVTWTIANHMKINEEKSRMLPLEKDLKYLGVYINSQYVWNLHLQHLKEKLVVAINQIKNVTMDDRKAVYFRKFHFSLARDILLWGNAADAVDIFRQQKQAISLFEQAEIVSRNTFVTNKILTAPSLYIRQCLRFIHRQHCSQAKHNQYLKQYASPIAVQLYNCIPDHIRKYGCSKFDKEITMILLSQAFYNLQEFFQFNWKTLSYLNIFNKKLHIMQLKWMLNEAITKIRTALMDKKKSTYFREFHSKLVDDVLLLCNALELKDIFEMQKEAIRELLDGSSATVKDLFIRNRILTVPSLYIYKCLRLAYIKKRNQRCPDDHTKSYTLKTVAKLYDYLPDNIGDQDYKNIMEYIREELLSSAFYNFQELYCHCKTINVTQRMSEIRKRHRMAFDNESFLRVSLNHIHWLDSATEEDSILRNLFQ